MEEIESPYGYLISNTPIQFEISSNVAYQTLPDTSTPVITIIQNDTSVKGKISVEKRGEVLVDFDGEFVYEEKGLANTKYEVVAKEDILDPCNDGTIIYKKGTVVDTITTGDEGLGTSKELPLGEYSVKEILAAESFVLSNEIKDVSLKYKDQNTAIVFDNTSFINDRQKVNLNVVKKDANEDIKLSGAKFGIYASEDIVNYQNEIIISAGTLIKIAESDENGYVHFSLDLPLNRFEIKEEKSPQGYSTSNEVIEVDATYKGQDIPTIELSYEFKDEIIQIEVSKQDITDGSEIEGAHLIVFEKDNEDKIIDNWISGQDGVNEDGSLKPHIIKGLEVGKTFTLRELISPYGFTIAQDIDFTVEDTNEIQKIKMEDETVLGRLHWNKVGEIFMSVAKMDTEYGKILVPTWHESNLLDSEITIYANEEIKIGNTVYYSKDEKIETLKSNLDTVVSKELPVGKYYYMESKIPYGYLIDTNKHYFEVADNQSKEVQVIKSTLENKRPKVNIDLTKVLEEQEIFINEEAYKDIVFGIFTRDDVYDYMGNTAIPKDSMVALSGITKEGKLINVPDLPAGRYFIKELSTNSQYLLDNNIEYDFEICYHGENVSTYTIKINQNGIIENKLARGSIKIVKYDTFDKDKKLENVEFAISKQANMEEIIAIAKTDKESSAIFERLELGTYYIQEYTQVSGYAINNHIYEVEIKVDGDLLEINVENKPTEMEFSKVDETGTNELPGATIQIIDSETNEIIEEWVSTTEPHKINYLEEGKCYIMREITCPYGYAQAEEISFIAGDGKKIKMQDMPIVPLPVIQTGNEMNYGILYAVLAISLTGSIVGIIILKRKNKERQNEG